MFILEGDAESGAFEVLEGKAIEIDPNLFSMAWAMSGDDKIAAYEAFIRWVFKCS